MGTASSQLLVFDQEAPTTTSTAVKTVFMCSFGSRCLTLPKSRKQLESEVGQLEVKLNRAGEGVQQEKDEMEAVLLRLSRALEGVDVELTQSAVRRIEPFRLFVSNSAITLADTS